jgi:hypothetical protein
MHKLDARTALGYVVAQLAGAGALPLLAWGSMGRSVVFGATLPGEGYSLGTVLMGEAVTTFALISGLCVFLAFRKLRPFTPAMFPFLYAVMVYVESPISGTSTNPARSLGPTIIAGGRSLEGMVGLLGWSADRYPRGNLCLRFPGEAPRSGKAVLFRHQSRSVASPRIVATANGSDG